MKIETRLEKETLAPADVELTRALERGQVATENFRHRSHLHVAWVYLAESGSVHEAMAKMRRTLQRFTASAGKAEKYHETITRFWIRLLGHLRVASGNSNLEEVLRKHPQLLEKEFPLEYYSSERLFSDGARQTWMEPDLKPLPSHVIPVCSGGSSSHASDRALS